MKNARELRYAFDQLSQRVNVKDHLKTIAGLVKAVEILQAREFWVVGRLGGHGKFDASQVRFSDCPFSTSIRCEGSFLTISRRYHFGDRSDDIDMVFLTKEEAEAKANELNEEEEKFDKAQARFEKAQKEAKL